MEATTLSDHRIAELRQLGRADKLRLLQILVDELAAENSACEMLAPFGNAEAVRALTEMLEESDESAAAIS